MKFHTDFSVVFNNSVNKQTQVEVITCVLF